MFCWQFLFILSSKIINDGSYIGEKVHVLKLTVGRNKLEISFDFTEIQLGLEGPGFNSYISYSGKLSREKTFADFAVL